MKKHFILFFALCLSPLLPDAFGQDVSQYFDDGESSTFNKIIKVGYDPINGEIPIGFEYNFQHWLSLELAAGPVSISRQSKLYSDDPLPIGNSGLGFTASLGFRIYLKGFYERSHFGMQPKMTWMDGTRFTEFVFFNYGYQRAIARKIIVDATIGMGVRSYKSVTMLGSVAYPEKDSNFYIPLTLSVGYAF